MSSSAAQTGIVEVEDSGSSVPDMESLLSRAGKGSAKEPRHHSRGGASSDHSRRHHSSAAKKSTNDDLASALMMSMVSGHNHDDYEDDDDQQCTIETEDSEESGTYTGSDGSEIDDENFDDDDAHDLLAGHSDHVSAVEADKLKAHCSEIGLSVLRESEFGANVNPLLTACASGNAELLDRIISDGLFCAKPFFVQLLYLAAAYPIEQVATDMYVIIKDAVAACNGADNASGYSECLKCRGFGSSK